MIYKSSLLLICSLQVFIACQLFGDEGKFINPLTDVCWDCFFPITLSGVEVNSSSASHGKDHTAICACAGTPPKIGIPLSFWEPAHIVDVTRHAYKLMGLGGVSIGQETIKNRGAVSVLGNGPNQTSFYQVHWYSFPLLSILDLLNDFSCLEKSPLDVLYMSELDPLWNDDNLSLLVNAEAALFSNPAAHLACLADCASANVNKSIDALFWCAGCEGSLYPLNGCVAHHVGGAQASALLVHRIIAKMHRCLQQKGYEEGEYCQAKLMPVIKKSLYKVQMAYPIPQTSGPCHALGQSDLLWGSGKSFPGKGEDFVYLIWKKRQCCLDAVKPAATVGGL